MPELADPASRRRAGATEGGARPMRAPGAGERSLVDYRRLLDDLRHGLDAGEIGLDHAAERVGRHACEALDCSRASMWRLKLSTVSGQRHRSLVRLGGWCAATGRAIEHPMVLREPDCPDWFATLSRDLVVLSPDTANDPSLDALRHRYLRPRDARAMLDVAITINAQPIGLLSLEQHDRVRPWSARDVGLAQRMALEIAVRRARRHRREDLLNRVRRLGDTDDL
jgi:GAF domain-containing protein